MESQHPPTDPQPHASPPIRRAVLMAAGAAAVGSALGGCVVKQQPDGPAAPVSAPPTAAGDQPSAGTPTAPTSDGTPAAPTSDGAAQPDPAAPAAQPLVKLSDLPPGGGVVLKAKNLVITKDTVGRVHAFSAVCTHQGCIVASVSAGTINCPCHGSKFDAATGAPVAGPAQQPLPPVRVQEHDDAVYPG
jgi:Rieske Fe-S protein